MSEIRKNGDLFRAIALCLLPLLLIALLPLRSHIEAAVQQAVRSPENINSIVSFMLLSNGYGLARALLLGPLLIFAAGCKPFARLRDSIIAFVIPACYLVVMLLLFSLMVSFWFYRYVGQADVLLLLAMAYLWRSIRALWSHRQQGRRGAAETREIPTE